MPFGITSEIAGLFNPKQEETTAQTTASQEVVTQETTAQEATAAEVETTTTTAQETTATESETTATETTEIPQTTTATAVAEPEITESHLLQWLEKNKGKKVTAIDELFVEKPQSEWDGIELDERDKAYLKFKKETNGRSYDEFLELNNDLSTVSDLDLARQEVRRSTGKQLTDSQVDAYLERKLNITDIAQLDEMDEIELAAFVKPVRENRETERAKFAVPLPTRQAAETAVEENVVVLGDGSKMPKEVYENLQKSREAYLNQIKAAVNGVAPTALKFDFDNNGKKESVQLGYEFDQADRHSMGSMAEDLDKTVADHFRTEKGFDYQGFSKAVWRLNPANWEKEVTVLINAALAQHTEELMKQENNVNFNRNSLNRTGGDEKIVDIFAPTSNGFKVRF